MSANLHFLKEKEEKNKGVAAQIYTFKKTKNEPLRTEKDTKHTEDLYIYLYIYIIMAGHDQTVNLIINHGRQLGRSLILLVHYAAVFVAFVGRTVQWMVDAVKWTSLFARYTVSVFDSIYRHLHWGKRKGVAAAAAGGGARDICPCSDMNPN